MLLPSIRMVRGWLRARARVRTPIGDSAMPASTVRAALLAAAVLLAPGKFFAVAQAAPSKPSDVSLLREAAQSIAAGNLPRAETQLHIVLKDDPADYRALNLLGIIRAQQHRQAEAEQLFRQAIARKPDFAGAHMDLGLLYAQSNRADAAIAQFRANLQVSTPSP